MQRLVFFRDDEGNEYTAIVTDDEYYQSVLHADMVGDVDLAVLDYDFGLWRTNTPLSADF